MINEKTGAVLIKAFSGDIFLRASEAHVLQIIRDYYISINNKPMRDSSLAVWASAVRLMNDEELSRLVIDEEPVDKVLTDVSNRLNANRNYPWNEKQGFTMD